MEEYVQLRDRQQIKIYMVALLEKFVLNELKTFTKQNNTGYHGLEHTEQVALRALDIAISLGYEKPEELTPVLLAAAIHDCARTDDEYNEYHGPKAAKMPEVTEFLTKFHLTDEQKCSVLKAAALHTVAMPDDGKNYDYIQKCLFDADRIRLSWEKGYAPQYFFTPRGHKLAAMSCSMVMEYLQFWDNLIREAGVKPLCGDLVSKYAIYYNSQIGQNRVLFVEPDDRKNSDKAI